MVLKIGGDTLALDVEIRRQIESEAQKLADRFPGERIEAQVNVQEEFDQLHGHRIRCELSAKLASGHQVLVREACKTAKEAIGEVFLSARRSMRRLRRQSMMEVAPTAPPAGRQAQAVTR
ncbi:HPF/RaiA family ribosome-associated protein [Thiorhodococcus minor]|uniref:HPF/RaiA family ribosome-associated protein n=1 Tax=Thiorhodococcus minor TaxID=57489 RepID=A0A6M0JWB5_9GAMM|nr:HPF/RaiA family ribosome-associated protein [Thiorhodococcus minor]NEV60455.1 HPF/RaiA family ribosome-associated protein [Thiorhodococcus minor]